MSSKNASWNLSVSSRSNKTRNEKEVASLRDWANAALKKIIQREGKSMPGLDEKRGTQRQPILKAGTISFDGSEIDCLVRNMSGEGANLEVQSQIGIPNSFDLKVSILNKDSSSSKRSK